MVIIHKQRVAITIKEMPLGTCFFDESGHLYMVTDEYDDIGETRTVVRLETGRLNYKNSDDVAVPVKLISVEVE